MHHPSCRHRRRAAGCAAAALIVGAGSAPAQTLPDAGSLLQQIEQQRQPVLPPKAPPLLTVPAPLESLAGETVTVTSFRFVGNTRLGTNELTPAVAGFLNKPLDLAALQNAAIAVANAYRKAGWVVRAYLPQQDITNGTVTIQVVEAVFGAVRVDGAATRLSSARAVRIVESTQAPGALLNGDALDRALLLLSDLPGLTASGRLVEGQGHAETDLSLTLANGPVFAGSVAGDNGGARSTGAARAIVEAGLNGPLGLGDRADASLLHTEGSDYARAGYALPVGSDGWRVGVSASSFRYRVIARQFAALEASGHSATGGLQATYPLLRSQSQNLYVSLGVDDRLFENVSAGATTTKYKVQVASVGLYGNSFDTIGGAGANVAGIFFEQGRTNLDGSPNQPADAASTQTAGVFRKLRFNASRQQALTDAVSLYAALSGQLASRNLDSSERIYLGGLTGVRAYPVSEGGGAEGAIANLEVRTRLPWNLSATGFFDWGTVQVNRRNDIAGAAAPNRYNLKGIGASLGWVGPYGLDLRATVARRIGGNPDATASGNDQDGSLHRNRVWLQAGLPF